MMGEHKYTKEAGIYKLTCINNQKIYIGKAVNIHKRINQHRYSTMKSVGSFYFERALIKNGWESFTVEILETFKDFDKSKDNPFLLEMESHYIKLFDSCNVDIGYNTCEFSTDRTGLKHSEDTKMKMSKSSLGKRASEATKEKMRKTRKGRKHSEETKQKISKSILGKVFSEEHKENLRKVSPNRIFTEESRERRRTANLGRKFSAESREKMRLAKLGKSRTFIKNK
jgi:group I intron endonuclease